MQTSVCHRKSVIQIVIKNITILDYKFHKTQKKIERKKEFHFSAYTFRVCGGEQKGRNNNNNKKKIRVFYKYFTLVLWRRKEKCLENEEHNVAVPVLILLCAEFFLSFL